MRIFICSQPKTGNVWVRNIVREIYHLADFTEQLGEEIPPTVPTFIEHIEKTGLPDDIVFHQHYFPRHELLDFCKQHDIHLITLLRSPYEAFVSFYHYVNKNREHFAGTPTFAIYGKPIDHPDVLEFLGDRYRLHINLSIQWLRSKASIMVRYEDMLRDPIAETTRMTQAMNPVSPEVVAHAVEQCQIDRFKERGGWMAKHVRSAQERTWPKYLTSAHLQVFRDRYGKLIEEMGYPVEDPETFVSEAVHG
jgi:hypothetical protein